MTSIHVIILYLICCLLETLSEKQLHAIVGYVIAIVLQYYGRIIFFCWLNWHNKRSARSPAHTPQPNLPINVQICTFLLFPNQCFLNYCLVMGFQQWLWWECQSDVFFTVWRNRLTNGVLILSWMWWGLWLWMTCAHVSVWNFRIKNKWNYLKDQICVTRFEVKKMCEKLWRILLKLDCVPHL